MKVPMPLLPKLGLAPQKLNLNLEALLKKYFRECLRGISIRFKLQRIATVVQHKHCVLLTRFSFMTFLKFDDEFDIRFL